MARIPEDELARLKREVDLAALVRASGVDLSPVGQDLRGRCPFHEDDGPSLVVTPGKNLWHCFGACGVGGGPIDWVMRRDGVSFRHAVEVLRAGGAAAPPALPHGKHATPLHADLPFAPDMTDQALLNQVVAYYATTLKVETDGLAYLARRGLRSSEMIERFKLGYANKTLGYRLPKKTWKEGQEVRARLANLGVMRESGHEHLAGSLVVPILDEHGNAQGLYGRKVVENLRYGTPKHLYLKGPHRGVWNVEALGVSREVILCEAPLDMLSFWAAGYRHVTSAFGVSGFTDEMLAAFQRHDVEKVLIAYDRDDAGDKAAEDLAPRLAAVGIDVWRVLFPRGTDANDFVRSSESPSEGLGTLLRGAQFMAKGRRAAAAPPSPSEAAESFTSTPATEPAGEKAAKGESSGGSSENVGASAAPEPAPDPSLAAASLPFAAPSLVVNGDSADLVIGDRAYRVGNLAKNLSPNAMRVTLRVSRGDKVHVDTLELLSSRARALYIKEAADELAVEPAVVKKDLGKLLLELEALQEKRIERVTAPKTKAVEIPEAEKAEAFALLRDPRLLTRIVEDLSRVGLVGEEPNKLVGYLAATSRKLSAPLAVLVQSNSAAGKSALMDAVLEIMPPEDVERYTAMTGQSLYYLADTSLKHKVLAIAEVAGADRAGYAIKMLQSEGKISIATTVKDPDTGEMKTKKHEVEGPVAVFLTTTEAEVDEELQNRAVVLTVNEDREQTRAIHEAQRRAETLEGILAAEERQAVVRLHRNAQRLLRPLRVVNPFAVGLTFLDTKLRARRDHAKYLTLIRAVALLHQYQRPIRQEEHNGRVVPYIEATIADIEVANRLANDAIGRSLDELAPQTRRLLLLLDEMVSARCRERKVDREDYRFTRREVREYAQWSDSQLWKHLSRLVELEHVLAHPGGRGHSYLYELVYAGQGKDGGRFLVGLIDPKRLVAGKEARGAGATVDLTPSEGRSHPPIYPPFTPDPWVSPVGGNGSGAALSAP